MQYMNPYKVYQSTIDKKPKNIYMTMPIDPNKIELLKPSASRDAHHSQDLWNKKYN